jgi:hypothetical protein
MLTVQRGIYKSKIELIIYQGVKLWVLVCLPIKRVIESRGFVVSSQEYNTWHKRHTVFILDRHVSISPIRPHCVVGLAALPNLVIYSVIVNTHV